MRKDVIISMMCHQYKFDHRDVEVECVARTDSTSTFEVRHDHLGDDIRSFMVTVEVTETTLSSSAVAQSVK